MIVDTEFIRPDDKSITRDDLKKFTYIEHPSNISVALEFVKELVSNGILP